MPSVSSRAPVESATHEQTTMRQEVFCFNIARSVIIGGHACEATDEKRRADDNETKMPSGSRASAACSDGKIKGTDPRGHAKKQNKIVLGHLGKRRGNAIR